MNVCTDEDGTMSHSRIAGCLALLSVACVLAVFFFPAVQGPYSVVHGPVTALHSVRAATSLRMMIYHAGLSALRSGIDFAWGNILSITVSKAVVRSERHTVGSSVSLRC
jgi:hypothetical protein